jgi:hypothetical protein
VAYLPGGASVPRTAWGVARQRSGVEVQHPVLHVPYIPLDDENGPRVVADAFADLERTWLAHNGRISIDFVEILNLLAAPPREVHGWIGLHNHIELGVVAATDGEVAVRVVSDPDGLYLDPIEPRKLVESVVELLPRWQAARRSSITVPRDAFEQSADGRRQGDSFMVKVEASTTVERDVAALRALLAGPRRGGGRFYVAARNRMGRRCTSEKPLTYLDLESGRMVFRERANSGGQSWFVAAPATSMSLLSDLGSMLSDVSRAV